MKSKEVSFITFKILNAFPHNDDKLILTMKNETLTGGSHTQVNEYRQDVIPYPALTSQEYLSPSPENGIIDTPLATSKTGSTTFAASVYRKHRLSHCPIRGQQLQVVSAVQLECSLGRDSAAAFDNRCSDSCTRNSSRRQPYATITTKDIGTSVASLSRKFWIKSAQTLWDCFRVHNSAVFYDKRNYFIANNLTQVDLCTRPKIVNLFLNAGVDDPHGLLLNIKTMNLSVSEFDSSKIRGSKIAELKKIFDSRVNETTVQVPCVKQCKDVNKNHDAGSVVDYQGVRALDKSNFSSLSDKSSGDEAYQRRSICRNGSADSSYGGVLKNGDLNDRVDQSKLENDKHSINNFTNRCDTKHSSKYGTGLWKGVEIGLNCENALWDTKQLNESSLHSEFGFKQSLENSYETSAIQDSDSLWVISQDSVLASTTELNNLIAASRAESLKKEADIPQEKSNLENYFAYAFENSKPQRKLPPNHMYPSNKHLMVNTEENSEDILEKTVPHTVSERMDHNGYECDMDEMMFDDLDDVAFSDTSSEEELKYHPSPPSHTHTQPFSLHTIIEESCEESERDSNTATPTNQSPTSKLEKYFSWDIVNNLHVHVQQQRDIDDNSTMYSDSLSEVSGSSNDDNKDFEPAHLSSSRLETYFTSGLVGNENYRYPDDAEFLDDVSEQCSDFDEEEACHKISRAALLNSLETSSTSMPPCFETFNRNCKFDISDEVAKPNADLSNGVNSQIEESSICQESVCDAKLQTTENESCQFKSINNIPDSVENKSTYGFIKRNLYTVNENCTNELEANEEVLNDTGSDALENTEQASEAKIESCTQETKTNDIEHIPEHSDDKLSEDSPKHIISKIISLLTEIAEHSDHESQPNHNIAWRLLESELTQLMKNVDVTTANSSSNSSTFGSSNSDYGSDTVDSGECLTTDEDDNCVDSKNKKEPCKLKKDKFLENENVEYWKKFLKSLSNGELLPALHSNSDDFNQAQSYIRDHIIAFLSSVDNSEGNLNSNKTIESCNDENKSNENTSHTTDSSQPNNIIIDEGISIDSTENLYSDTETVSSVCAMEDNLSKKVEDWYSSNASAMTVENNELPQESIFFQPEGTLPNFQLDTCEKDDIDPVDVEIPEKFKNVDISNDSCNMSFDDSSSHFSVYVDINIGEEATIVTERHRDDAVNEHHHHGDILNEHHDDDDVITDSLTRDAVGRSSLRSWGLDDHAPVQLNEYSHCAEKVIILPTMSGKCFSEPNLVDTDGANQECNKISEFLEKTSMIQRDTGYYSFKSSDDSILGVSESIYTRSESATCTRSDFDESHPNSIRSSIKSNTSVKVLSSSTTNIPASTNSELKFNTLQPKPRAVKVSMNPTTHKVDYRPVTSYFSPVSVLKRLLPSKMTNSPSSEISYPSKYLKKYGRSSSVDDESILGATSMPHLNMSSSSDAHSVGAAMDYERDGSLTDDELENKHSQTRYTQSVLSLGAHSASTTSVYSAAGGRHYGYVTVSGDVLFGLNYNQKSQTMEVFVKQCRNLAAIDIRRNKSDPYVKVYLLPDKTKSGKRKTKTKRNTLNPVFNELLRFPVLKHELESRTLWLSVWNSDMFGRNDFLGEITLTLGYRLLDSPTLRWYPLQERAESLASPLTYKGELYLALKYVPKDLSLEPRFRPAPVIALRGALHVLVKEARNISATGGNGTSDAFCKSYLLPDKSKGSKQKTPVIKRSRHPKWYYTMIYEDLSVDELRERSLELTVWDHDKITSNDFLGAVRLNTGSGLYHGVPVDWMDSSRDEASLWIAMLERPNMWVDGSLLLRPTMQSIRC